MDKSNCTIVGSDNCRVYFQGHILEFPIDARSNLPILKQACGSTKFVAALLGSKVAIDPSKSTGALLQRPPDLRLNTNLTGARKALLDFHRQCGHLNMQLIQQWARKGDYGLDPALGHCKIPTCSDCLYGAKRKPHNSTADDTPAAALPGDFVATNQMESPIGGLIPFHTGQCSKRRYSCSTLFVDNVTKYVHCCHQETATSKETVVTTVIKTRSV